jgi:EpsI family protein
MIQRCAILIVLLILASTARATLGVSDIVTTAEPLSRFPSAIDAWTGTDARLEADVVKVAAVNDYLNRTYRSNAGTVGLYVGYYQSQRQGESLHSPLFCLPGSGWQPLVTRRVPLDPPDGVSRTVNELVVARGLDRLLVLYWYQTRNRVTASEYARKLFQVTDTFTSDRTDVALVRIVAPINALDDAGEHQALALARPFAERILPELQTRLFRD